jgi:alpha-beta hydrolase superfamily lysophospholipase
MPFHVPGSSLRAPVPVRILALVLGSLTAGAVLQPSVSAAGRIVAFRAADGRAVTGLLMEASLRPAPAVVLVPMLGRSRDEWQNVAQRLAEAHVTSLAIDLPGSSLPGDPAALAAWQADVQAAVEYLAGRADVRPGALGIAGASLGANLAVLTAAADRRVRSLALVSPSLDYRGVRIEAPMRQYGARPALLVASLRDPFAARTVRELTKDPPGPREARWAETVAHGTTLLAREPDLVRALAEWFQRTLG